MSDFLPTIPNPVRLSHICCLLFKETSVSAKRVSLALYFIDAFHILLQAYSVTGYILTLFKLSNSKVTRSAYMCISYTLSCHALTVSPPSLGRAPVSFVGPWGWTLRPVAPYHVRRVYVGVSGTRDCYMFQISMQK